MNASIIMAVFADAMAVRNIIVPHPLLPDGKLHRCDAVGRNGKGDAAYVLHLDGLPAGGFQNFRDCTGWENWHFDVRRPKLSAAEWAAYQKRIAAAKAESEADTRKRIAEAARKAIGIWQHARPIAETIAETYLAHRGLHFHDPSGDVLRFADRRARQSLVGELEYHPALLAVLCDVRTGEACGIINIHLRPDGTDRLRDKKGKTVTGRAKDAAVMLSDFADVTYGLTTCEGLETGVALLADDMAPIWCCGGASNLAKFPMLGGIEALTVAADTGKPGQDAADEVARCWRDAGRQVRIITPRHGDWADPGGRSYEPGPDR